MKICFANIKKLKTKLILTSGIILLVLFASCTKHEFNNPIDPGNPSLNAASNLTVSAFTDTSVVLSWTNTNAQLRTGTIQVVVVERSLDKTKYDVLTVDTLETEGNTLTAYYNFNPDTTYYFRIRQFFGGRTDGEYTAPTTAISWKLKPTILIYSFYNDTKLKLTWVDNSNYETGYEIEQSTDNVSFTKVAETIANVATVDVAGAYQTALTYYFRVRAKSVNNFTAYTSAVSVKLIFNAPSNLAYSFYDDTKLKLTWTDNSNCETGFEIEQSSDNVTFTKTTDVLANVTIADISGAYLSGTNYYFRVRAKSTNNVSLYSNSVSSTVVFNAPSNLTYSFYDDTKIKLLWTDNSNCESGFEIEQSTDNINFTKLTETAANITTIDVTGNYLTQIYYFRVRAKSVINISGYSNQVTATMVAPNGFVLVQGGTYTMGSSSGNSDELPLHSVTLSSFYISKTEVTQGQWKAVMGTNPSNFSSVGDNGPVEQVSWYDCISYCNKLSIKEGKPPCYSISGNTSPIDWTSGTIACDFTAKGYRLPTEAEWEYAARGGNKSAGYSYSGSNTLNDVAWNNSNSGSTTHIVGAKTANELGINDMSGNVWEWCWDWFGSYSNSSQTNPTGAASGSYHIVRGGSWSYGDYDCRSSNRYLSYFPSSYYYIYFGFRPVSTM